jgi:hypothetical protein
MSGVNNLPPSFINSFINNQGKALIKNAAISVMVHGATILVVGTMKKTAPGALQWANKAFSWLTSSKIIKGAEKFLFQGKFSKFVAPSSKILKAILANVGGNQNGIMSSGESFIKSFLPALFLSTMPTASYALVQPLSKIPIIFNFEASTAFSKFAIKEAYCFLLQKIIDKYIKQ